MDIQSAVVKMRAEGKPWKDIFREVKPLLPDMTNEQAYSKMKNIWQNREPIPEEAKIDECASVEYKDGLIISEKFITVQDGIDMTPEFILEAHGLKVGEWDVI